MSSEKQRLFLFMMLSFASYFAIEYLLDKTGIAPRPKPRQVAHKVVDPKAEADPKRALAKGDGPEKKTGKAGEPGKEQAEGKDAKTDVDAAKDDASKRVVDAKRLPFEALTLGSTTGQGPDGYRLEARLEQAGAGLMSLQSSKYEAEFEPGQAKHRPLSILRADPITPPTLAINILSVSDAGAAPLEKKAGDDAPRPEAADDTGIIALDSVLWEVVPDAKGRLTRPIPIDADPASEQGRECVFRAVVKRPPLVVTKTIRLMKQSDAVEMSLSVASGDRERKVVYELVGPHGVPIEGEWYTSTFQDAFFGQRDSSGVKIVTQPAGTIAKDGAKPFDNTALPLAFAGIENQYFAAFIEPKPATPDDRWDERTYATVVRRKPDVQKSDIGVNIQSRVLEVGPNRELKHDYALYAGPKLYDSLLAYGAEDLSSYRKAWVPIPYASTLSKAVIAPLLDVIYGFTQRVARLFGRQNGSYGVAIILLTMTVRTMLLPLSRKQAMLAKKMQELQPHLKEIQEKHKEDKEKLTKETWALYGKHKANPMGGCLPALIQMPILVALWQALNNSVPLRHARFLWINNLAAPDMLFKFPFEIPLIGGFLGPYFNVLPLVVVSLMLIQTKLFSPPATTPEAEQQQKMMKYMMMFMAVMFYKVPSGLGIYFITSSLWTIGERIIWPRILPDKPLALAGLGADGADVDSPPKPQGRFGRWFEKVLEEASKDTTIRNAREQSRSNDHGASSGNVRNGSGRDKPRVKSGRKR